MRLEGFELLLFSTDVALITEAVDAGVDGVIVDWERRGKHERQAGADTEIRADTEADLRRVRGATDARVLCRIDALGPGTAGQVSVAIGAGADELLVPMVRRAAEVERVLDLVGGRCAVGALIETTDAVNDAHAIAALPLSRIYVGLNDLAIDRGSSSIFDAVADGTVDAVRAVVRTRFGVAGLTRPDRGAPIPSRLLAGELVRLGAAFTFLRRSYCRHVAAGEQAEAIVAIRAMLAAAAARSADEARRDRRDLLSAIAATQQPVA